MNRWYGRIGFAESVEIRKGYFKNEIIEKKFYGEIKRVAIRSENSESIIDDVNVTNQISIIADSFALNSFHKIKYIEFYGALWKVTSVDIQAPRLILTIGGLWNGETASTAAGT